MKKSNRPNKTKHSARQDMVRLHRAIFNKNQIRINESVYGYTKAFQQYEREYTRSLKGAIRRARLSQLDKAMEKSGIVYVGDYHTLLQSQRAFLRLLRRLPPEREVALALEFVQGRRQRALDAYMAGECAEETFLEKIHYDTHWGFGDWPTLRSILEIAKKKHAPVVGIDMASHGPAGKSLKARDQYAAKKIRQVIRKHPNALVMVLIGELHTAPSHLPLEVKKELEKEKALCVPLILHQNSHEIYWQLVSKAWEQEVELVQLSNERFCLMNTPPIVCQQSFLNKLEVDDALLLGETPKENFKEFAKLIARFFDLPLAAALDEVDVTTVVDLSFFERLQKRGDFSAADIRFLKKQILESESCYIPQVHMVYLGNLSVNHAAEEATHFLRHMCAPSEEPTWTVGMFYSRCLEEALGFLGSKIVNHKRKAPNLVVLEREARKGTKQQKEVVRLVNKHLRMEQGKRIRSTKDLYDVSKDVLNQVTHVLGYLLGERMYYALMTGLLVKGMVRDLFTQSFAEEGDALATYLFLATCTRDVKIPERM